MASGVTHILLMKYLQNQLPEGTLKMVLADGRDFLQVGAVGPDLPYASIADNDFFFSAQSDLADKFHYEKTNEIPLRAFERIKQMENELNRKEKRHLFSFFLGFLSHVIADGIIHPFVRDKVGNYKENQTAHRVLEMQLDVLLFHHLTKNSNAPIKLNYSNVHDELKNFNTGFYPEVKKTVELFRELISEVYNVSYNVDLILGWVTGLHRMFDIAEGDHPSIYKNIGFIGEFLFSDYEDLRNKFGSILTLEKPKDREVNFLKKDTIHFFDDCMPHFYKVFIPIAEKAYDFTFNNKTALSSNEIPGIDLDTGRILAQHNNLDLIPAFWS